MIAGIIGATGYAGAELARLLTGHSKIEKLILSSVSFEGERIENIYPNFLGRLSSPLLKAEDVISSPEVKVVFSALPHAVGEPYGAACIEKGKHFIDLSADFRFDDDEAVYSAWYGKPYQFPELHKKSVYGLPELNREVIKEKVLNHTVIIGNPGCYPTGASLGIFPAIAFNSQNAGIADFDKMPIIVNAVSGVSGGGREPSRSFHYSECADSVAPYKVASHRHSPEIARNIAVMASRSPKYSGLSAEAYPKVIFTPHLAPMNRGILSTIYIPLSDEWRVTPQNARQKRHADSDETPAALPPGGLPLGGQPFPPSNENEEATAKIRQIYADFYKNEPFVRVLPPGLTAAANRVRHSNFCDISTHIDLNGSVLIVTTAIDNMIKGAAGQAVQNMNIIFGFDETIGLEAIPMLF